MRSVHALACAGIWFSAYFAPTVRAQSSTLTFDGLDLGTTYGDGINVPGDVVVEPVSGIRMSVENFLFTGQTGVDFFEAHVVPAHAMRFPTRWLELNNISVQFDFTQVGFDVTRVSLEYLELGGLANFSVNGTRPIIEIGSLNNLGDVAPGVAMSILELDPLTHRTRLTLIGDIDRVLIGGQELGVDTVVAVPEPATWALMIACGACILWRGSRRTSKPASP